MLSLLYRIRCFVHIQSDHALDLGNICRIASIIFTPFLLGDWVVLSLSATTNPAIPFAAR